MSKKKRENSQGAGVPPLNPDKNDGSMDLDAVSDDEMDKILSGKPGQAKDPAPAKSPENNDDPPESPECGKALEELKKAAGERDEFYDLLLRNRAEFDNYRKRTARERETLEQDSVAEFLKKILPVIDDFERFVKAGDGKSEKETALYEGAKAIYAKLLKILADYGLSRMKAAGEDFDLFRHEAVIAEEVPDCEKSKVLEAFEEGYEFKGRVLRPARVRISKPPAAKKAEAPHVEGSSPDGERKG